MNVHRKGPHRATSPAVFELRNRLGDAAINVQCMSWLQVEAALQALPSEALASLAARVSAALDGAVQAERESWRKRFEEPQQRSTG